MIDWTAIGVGLTVELVGIFFAVFLAFVTERWWERQREERARTGRRKEIVRFVLSELKKNVDILQFRRSSFPEYAKRVIDDPLHTEFWESISATGDLSVLEKPELLEEVASAYRVISHVKAQERTLSGQDFQKLFEGGVGRPAPAHVDHMISHSAVARESVRASIARIEQLSRF